MDRKWILLVEFVEALAAYSAMDRREDFSDARDRLEGLAHSWREVGERLERLADPVLPAEALQLLAALEASLILACAEEPERRALRLEHPEIVMRAYLAGEGGTFGDDWQAELERGFGELRGGRRPAPQARPTVSRHPGRPIPRFGRPGQRKRVARVRELIAVAEEVLLESLTIYRDLGPDGRELTTGERDAVCRELEVLAHADRTIDLERYLFAQGDWDLLQVLLAECRAVRRSMTLACSEDPSRRIKAMSVQEVQTRMLTANERLIAAFGAAADMDPASSGAESGMVGS